MTKLVQPLCLALILLLFAVCLSETITVPSSSSKAKSSANNGFPTASDVASVGSSPILNNLGLGSDVGLGSSAANNSSSFVFDANALDQLSQMVNQILASLNNNSSGDSTQPSQNSRVGATENGNQNADPIVNIDPTPKPNPASTTKTTTSSTKTTADNNKPTAQTTTTTKTSTPINTEASKSTTSITSTAASTKPASTSSTSSTKSATTTIPSSNTKPAATSSSTKSTPAATTTTETAPASNSNNNVPSTSVPNSSKPTQYVDPLFTFQDYLTDPSISSTDSLSTLTQPQGSSSQKAADNGSNSNIDSVNDTSSQNQSAISNTTEGTTQYAPDNTYSEPASSDTKTNTTSSAPAPTAAKNQTAKARSSSSNLCETDQDCLLDYGSYAAAGLTITCKKDQGVCTFE